MKKLLIIIFLLIPLLASAQSGLIEHQFKMDRMHFEIKENKGSFDQHTKPLLIQSASQDSRSFNIAMADTIVRFDFDPNSIFTLTGEITNLTTDPVKIIFNRTHLRLPQEWTSSVCFGANCFSPKTDSIQPSNAFNLEPGTKGSFILNIYCPTARRDSVIDYIRFTSLTGDPGDTQSFVLKGVLGASAAVGKSPSKIGGR